MNISDFSDKHNVAVLRPFHCLDSETGDIVSLTVSTRYSILTVAGIEYYFLRESGEFDGTARALVTGGPILIYDGE